MNSNAKIQEKADKLINEVGFKGIPISTESIAKHLGYECHFFTPDSRTANISGAVDHNKKRIYINNTESPYRMNFTVAHEIGHIVLHDHDKDFIDYRKPSDDPREKEADSFAGNLLMPEDIFRYEWNKHCDNLNILSDKFRVSVPAIVMRAYHLGLA